MGRDRRRTLMVIVLFNFVATSSLVLLFVVFVGCLLMMVDVYVDEGNRGSLACELDCSHSCTGCDLPAANRSNVCPEWSIDDVNMVLQTQGKTSATISGVFMLYSIAALAFGRSLYRRVSNYVIAYV